MAKVDNFSELWKQKASSLPALGSEECILFGSHVYILKPEVNITETLAALAQGSACSSPVRYLHLYCRQLNATPDTDGVVELNLNQGCLEIKSLYIFTCEFLMSNAPTRIVSILSSTGATVSLYCESGPETLWIGTRRPGETGCTFSYHVLRHVSGCSGRDTPLCPHLHHDLDPMAAGTSIQILGGGALSIKPIPDVPLQELRQITYSDFKAFGGDIRRIQNLPRLVEGMFTAAGKELMGGKPDIKSIIRQLRFIIRCTRRSPLHIQLVDNAMTLLGRLEIPLGYPGRSDNETDAVHDWFFVPEHNPTAYVGVINNLVNRLKRVEDNITNSDRDAALRKLIGDSTGTILESVELAVRSYVDVEGLEAKAVEKTRDAEDRRTTLKRYQWEMNEAAKEFNKGVEKFKKERVDELRNEIIMGVGKCVVFIGIAVFTGGAGAPLTVGAFNAMRETGATLVKESSKLWLAFKALGETLLKIYPALKGAMENQESFALPGLSKGSKASATRAEIAGLIQRAAKDVTSQDTAGKAAQRIDYLGLLADWRQFDLQVDQAFDAIRDDVLPKRISGLEEYRLAMKKLAVRGETMLVAMREAYDARQSFLTAGAEASARAEKERELGQLADSVRASSSSEAALAWAVLKWRLEQELTGLKQAAFNALHEGILALTYETNNVKCQKQDFGKLRPDLDADKFDRFRTTFENVEVKFSHQPSSFNVSVGTVGRPGAPAVFDPVTWKDLLCQDMQVPFHVPPTLKDLKSYHRIRIRKVHAEFLGLRYKDATKDPTDGLKQLPYTIYLGPLMLDKTTVYADSSDYTVVQYYMNETSIHKRGMTNNLLDDKQRFSRRALCSLGWVTFDRDVIDEEGWDLTTVTDIRLHFTCEGLPFKVKAGR